MPKFRPAGSAMNVNEEQSSKAPTPMFVRLAGSAIAINEEQPEKVYSPRLTRPAGSAIAVSEEQPVGKGGKGAGMTKDAMQRKG